MCTVATTNAHKRRHSLNTKYKSPIKRTQESSDWPNLFEPKSNLFEPKSL